MNEKEDTQPVRRILVALDASPHSLTALAAAARLAQELQAALMGLFVEDVNLLKLAQLPFAQEIHYPRATTQKLDAPLMEKRLREQADQAKESLRQIAEQASLAWSFRVSRGAVTAELLAAAVEADLLVLGRISRRLARSPRLGSTARTAVTQAKPPILLLGSAFDLTEPLLVVYDGSAMAQKALVMAAAIAKVGGHLRVLIWASDEAAPQYRADVTAYLVNDDLTISFRRLFSSDNIADVIQGSNVGLLVMGDAETPFTRKTIQTALEETDHPILVVR